MKPATQVTAWNRWRRLASAGASLALCWPLATFGASPPSPALRIAAASDLRFVLDALQASPNFRGSGLSLEVVYGSSGQFVQQILHGAPFDLFLAADEQSLEPLLKTQKQEGPAFQYGTGRLVVWARNDAKVPWRSNAGLRFLLDPRVEKIAIANPHHAPYGRLAERALTIQSLHATLQARLVTGDGVAQAAQFAQSGAATLGLISESLARAEPMRKLGHFFVVDAKFAPPLKASGLILKTSTHIREAVRFRDLLLGPAGQRILDEFGLAKGS